MMEGGIIVGVRVARASQDWNLRFGPQNWTAVCADTILLWTTRRAWWKLHGVLLWNAEDTAGTTSTLTEGFVWPPISCRDGRTG